MKSLSVVFIFLLCSLVIAGCFSDKNVTDRISSVSGNENTLSISIPNFTSSSSSRMKIEGPFKLTLIITPEGLESRSIDLNLSDIWNASTNSYVYQVLNVPSVTTGIVIYIKDNTGKTLYSYANPAYAVTSGTNDLTVSLTQTSLEQLTGKKLYQFFPLAQYYTYNYSEYYASEFYDSSYTLLPAGGSGNDSITINTSSYGPLNTQVYPGGTVSGVTLNDSMGDYQEYYKWSADNTSLYYLGKFDETSDNKMYWQSGGAYGTYDNVTVTYLLSFEANVSPVLKEADMILGNTTPTVTLPGHIVIHLSGGDLDEGAPYFDAPMSNPTWLPEYYTVQVKQSWYFADVVDSGSYTDCLQLISRTEVLDTANGKIMKEIVTEALFAPNVGVVKSKTWETNFDYDPGNNLVGINRELEDHNLTSFSTVPY